MDIRYNHLKINGSNIRFLELGEGDSAPFVFLHGFSIPPHCYIDYLREISEAGFRVYSPDLHPKIGDNHKPANFREYGEKLGEFCSSIGIRDVNLGGHSSGARVIDSFIEGYGKQINVNSAIYFAPAIPFKGSFLEFASRSAKGWLEDSIVDTDGLGRFKCLDRLVYPYWNALSFGNGLKEMVSLSEEVIGLKIEDIPGHDLPSKFLLSGEDIFYPMVETKDDIAQLKNRYRNAIFIYLKNENHSFITDNPSAAGEMTLDFLASRR